MAEFFQVLGKERGVSFSIAWTWEESSLGGVLFGGLGELSLSLAGSIAAAAAAAVGRLPTFPGASCTL